MPNAVETKKRLNTIVEAAVNTFNTHLQRGIKEESSTYSFAVAARAMVQEAFDLGKGATKEGVAEEVKVDYVDPNPTKVEG